MTLWPIALMITGILIFIKSFDFILAPDQSFGDFSSHRTRGFYLFMGLLMGLVLQNIWCGLFMSLLLLTKYKMQLKEAGLFVLALHLGNLIPFPLLDHAVVYLLCFVLLLSLRYNQLFPLILSILAVLCIEWAFTYYESLIFGKKGLSPFILGMYSSLSHLHMSPYQAESSLFFLGFVGGETLIVALISQLFPSHAKRFYLPYGLASITSILILILLVPFVVTSWIVNISFHLLTVLFFLIYKPIIFHFFDMYANQVKIEDIKDFRKLMDFGYKEARNYITNLPDQFDHLGMKKQKKTFLHTLNKVQGLNENLVRQLNQYYKYQENKGESYQRLLVILFLLEETQNKLVAMAKNKASMDLENLLEEIKKLLEEMQYQASKNYFSTYEIYSTAYQCDLIRENLLDKNMEDYTKDKIDYVAMRKNHDFLHNMGEFTELLKNLADQFSEEE